MICFNFRDNNECQFGDKCCFSHNADGSLEENKVRAPREPRAPRGPRAPREEPREPRAPRGPRAREEPREPRAPRGPRAPREEHKAPPPRGNECYFFRDTGACARGESCRFSHVAAGAPRERAPRERACKMNSPRGEERRYRWKQSSIRYAQFSGVPNFTRELRAASVNKDRRLCIELVGKYLPLQGILDEKLTYDVMKALIFLQDMSTFNRVWNDIEQKSVYQCALYLKACVMQGLFKVGQEGDLTWQRMRGDSTISHHTTP